MLRKLNWLGLSVVLGLAACSTPQGDSTRMTKREAAGAIENVNGKLPNGEIPDMVVYFPSWEYVGFMKPLVRDGRFLRFMNQTAAENTLKNLPVRKRTAVIICDLSIPGFDRTMEMEDWVRILAREGWRKVVFLRKDPTEPLSAGTVLRENLLAKK